MEDTTKTCSTCSGATSGYKCDGCETETTEHDTSHACGPDMCMPKCEPCNKGDKNCICEPKAM